MVIKKGVEVSRLSGAESVVGQRGKSESCILLASSEHTGLSLPCIV